MRVDLGDELRHDGEDLATSCSRAHELRPPVVRIGNALDVAVLLEVGDELGHPLLRHLRPLGEDSDARAGVVQVLEHVAMRVANRRVPALGELRDQRLAHRAERLAQEDCEILRRLARGGLRELA